MLSQLNFIDKEIKAVSNTIRAYCRTHHKKDYDLLRSTPGIGPLTAAYIISEVGDIRRFSSFKKFASYIGIIPNLHSSGEKTKAIGVTIRANSKYFRDFRPFNVQNIRSRVGKGLHLKIARQVFHSSESFLVSILY